LVLRGALVVLELDVLGQLAAFRQFPIVAFLRPLVQLL
jgi:hypothetical protein